MTGQEREAKGRAVPVLMANAQPRKIASFAEYCDILKREDALTSIFGEIDVVWQLEAKRLGPKGNERALWFIPCSFEKEARQISVLK